MDFSLSPEQLMIQDSFRSALNDLSTLSTVRAAAASNGEADGSLWPAMTQLGMPGLLIAPAHGGVGLNLLDAAIVSQEMGRFTASVPFTASAVMAPLALTLGGSHAQQQQWLPALATGKKRMAVAVSDLAAGTRAGAGVSPAGGALSGRAAFAQDTGSCDAVLLADDQQVLHLLAADAPGLKITAMQTIDGTRQVATLELDGVAVNPLPELTPELLQRVINAGRIMLAADTLGATQSMLSQAVAYAQQRERFGRPIAGFQAVKHLCAEMAAQIEPGEALVWYAAYAFDEIPGEAPLAIALAKSHMDEVGRFVARTATEVHGGMGFTDLQGLHYWFKRIGMNRAMLGGPEAMRERAAQLQGF